MPGDGFRLPGSSHQELVRIIRAYGNLNLEAAPSEVSKLAAMHEAIISRNNAFLVSVRQEGAYYETTKG